MRSIVIILLVLVPIICLSQRQVYEFGIKATSCWYFSIDGCQAFFEATKGNRAITLKVKRLSDRITTPIFVKINGRFTTIHAKGKVRRFYTYSINTNYRSSLYIESIYIYTESGWSVIYVNDDLNKLIKFINPKN